ncbi:MAG: hypothetical protein ACJ76J_29045 [Thermoanaerobaculia bacterium]
MANEWQYMNTVNGWDKMDVAVTANAAQVPELEVNLAKLRERAQRARALFAQQAALTAAKQEVTKELKQVILEGNSLVKFLREGVRAYLGKRSEKLIEFGVQPFRGLNRTAAAKRRETGTSTPPVPAPDSVK